MKINNIGNTSFGKIIQVDECNIGRRPKWVMEQKNYKEIIRRSQEEPVDSYEYVSRNGLDKSIKEKKKDKNIQYYVPINTGFLTYIFTGKDATNYLNSYNKAMNETKKGIKDGKNCAELEEIWYQHHDRMDAHIEQARNKGKVDTTTVSVNHLV